MKIKALIIGINHYNGIESLNGCENDAKDWEKLLINYYNVCPSNIIRLRYRYETKSDYILKVFKKFIHNLKNEQLGIFIFSGHGVIEKKEVGNKIIIEERIRVVDRTITDQEIRERLDPLKDKAKLISIIDSCFSGGVEFYKDGLCNIDDSIKNKYLKSKTYEASNKVINPTNKEIIYKNFFKDISTLNRLTLTASKNNEEAFEDIIKNRFNGIFSRYLIDVLKNDPLITYKEAISILQKKLPDLSKEYLQTPQYLNESGIINQTFFN
ncbi:caspase family protein [uncultured Dokdonia sp.]|uniref:caspase family protein n=1 Tax=uncultured Dokdonia sp. TaxID=575653 RepID=UPI00260FB1A6|nr:caspase family protein [uncultured Dokdonia sp.]